MSLLVVRGGDEHCGCGDDGCDCSLEGTAEQKSREQMLQHAFPEGRGPKISFFHCFDETETNILHKVDYIALL